MTNGDKIRAMTNEELARYCAGNYCPTDNCPKDSGLHPTGYSCTKCWLDWLQSPAEGGDGDA